MVLAMNAGMDSAIVDPTNKNMIGMIYATNALLERDEYCLQYIDNLETKPLKKYSLHRLLHLMRRCRKYSN